MMPPLIKGRCLRRLKESENGTCEQKKCCLAVLSVIRKRLSRAICSICNADLSRGGKDPKPGFFLGQNGSLVLKNKQTKNCLCYRVTLLADIYVLFFYHFINNGGYA